MTLCVYGFDPSYLSWVEKSNEHRLIFVDNVERGSDHPRVQMVHVESPFLIELFAKKIAWDAALQKLEVVLHKKSPEAAHFKAALETAHKGAQLLLLETADLGANVLKNTRANRCIHRKGMDLKGRFKGIPALIVGAGPSLKKNGYLIEKFQNRALIFAAGSGMHGLKAEPHFAGSIDPKAPYTQFKTHTCFETPFCYQSRMNAQNFSIVHGEKLLFPDPAYPSVNWLNETEEDFEGGWTVGTFMTSAAVHFGCDPLILIGMDFAAENGEKYAYLQAPAIHEVQTDWEMSVRFIEELAKKHPERRFLNATEGGTPFCIQETLENVLDQCAQERDLKKMVHEAIQSLNLYSPSEERWQEWDRQGEIVEEKLLEPLWKIWGPPIAQMAKENGQDLDLHQKIFFQRILQGHYG